MEVKYEVVEWRSWGRGGGGGEVREVSVELECE